MDRGAITQELWHAWNAGIHDEALQHLCEDVVARPIEVTLQSFEGLEEIEHLRSTLEDLGIQVFSTPFSWEEHRESVIVQGRSRVVRKATPMTCGWPGSSDSEARRSRSSRRS